MVRQILVADLAAMRKAGAPLVLLDVRQPWEHAVCALPGSILIPLGELKARAGEIAVPEGATVVAYCHHGVRSLDAAAWLDGLGVSVVSLAGGIDRWSIEIDPDLPRY